MATNAKGKQMTTAISKAAALKLSRRYHRGHQNSAISSAVRLACELGITMYVYPTCEGFKVEKTQPVTGSYFSVTWANDEANAVTVR